MKTNKHLNQNQLIGYASGLIEQSESQVIGNHLLNCDVCRDSLPAPTPQQFLAILMGEKEIEEFHMGKDSISLLSRFSTFQAIFQKPSTLVWSSGALVFILGFSILIWFAIQPAENREVAQTFDNEMVQLKQDEIIEPIPESPVQNSGTEDNVYSPASNRADTDSKPTLSKKARQKRDQNLSENNLRSIPTKKNLNENKGNVSSTRGVSPKCSDENLVEMEFVSNDEAITFSWTKVPNALKYHLYISDDEEILIDEYETARGTVYVLKKMLDPAKTYKWKVVITLENGQTSAGTSQKFTVKDVQQNQKKLINKKKPEIRCTENK